MHERTTKILIAKNMLPEDADAAVHLAIKDAQTYDVYRSTLRNSIQYLMDHEVLKLRRGAAHLAE